MIKITKAKVADAQAIRQLETVVWKEEVTNKYDAPIFVRFGWCYVAKSGQKIVAAITSFLANTNEVYVCDWVVAEAYRRKDIGQRLYQTLIKAAGSRDIISLINPKNTASLLAHEKLGFKVVRRVKMAYGLRDGLEAGNRILVRRKHT